MRAGGTQSRAVTEPQRDLVVQIPPPQPYSEAKKDIMASNPRNLTIPGFFIALSHFFATMRVADIECRKKITL